LSATLSVFLRFVTTEGKDATVKDRIVLSEIFVDELDRCRKFPIGQVKKRRGFRGREPFDIARGDSPLEQYSSDWDLCLPLR
jgi:hypothetical protein